MVGKERGLAHGALGGLNGVSPELQDRIAKLEARMREQAALLEDLRDSEMRLAEAERIARMGSFEWDITTGAVTWSPGLFKLFGTDPDHFVPTYQGFLSFVYPADRDAMDRRIRSCLESGQTYEHVYRFVRQDGAVRTMRSRGEISRDERGHSVKMRGTCQDVTEELAAERAQELGRIKDHFLSSISHEMKTPLSLVIGYAELLQERYPQCDLLEGLQEGARRLTYLVSNIVDLAALLSGSLTLYRTEVSPAEAAEHAVLSVWRQCQQGDVRVEMEFGPDMPPIWADARRVVQMLVELLDNAIKFSPAGGTVRVEGRAERDAVHLSVVDAGPGLDPSALSRVFEAFHQEEIGSAMRKGGIGIGLAIVKLLAELHGGRVEVESKPGAGSRFTIVLPIAKAA